MRPERALLIALLASGCGSPDRGEIGSLAQSIVGGTPTDAYGEVVGVLTESSTMFCSGVLIANDLVLTAAQCLPVEYPADQSCPTFVPTTPHASDVVVLFGAKMVASDVIAVEVLDYAVPAPEPCHNDLALLQLAEPVDAAVAVPRAFRTEPVVAGEPISAVGFGSMDGQWGSAGEKNVGHGTVSCAEPACFGAEADAVFMSDNLLLGNGDSGAPVLDEDGLVIGLGSFYTTSGPDIQSSGFTDVTRFAEFLTTTLHGPPEPPDPPDPAPDPAEQTLQVGENGGCTVNPRPRPTWSGLMAMALTLLAFRRRRAA